MIPSLNASMGVPSMGGLSPSYEPGDCEIAQVGKFVVALVSHS